MITFQSTEFGSQNTVALRLAIIYSERKQKITNIIVVNFLWLFFIFQGFFFIFHFD